MADDSRLKIKSSLSKPFCLYKYEFFSMSRVSNKNVNAGIKLYNITNDNVMVRCFNSTDEIMRLNGVGSRNAIFL